jgi:hypothetical protein
MLEKVTSMPQWTMGKGWVDSLCDYMIGSLVNVLKCFCFCFGKLSYLLHHRINNGLSPSLSFDVSTCANGSLDTSLESHRDVDVQRDINTK